MRTSPREITFSKISKGCPQSYFENIKTRIYTPTLIEHKILIQIVEVVLLRGDKYVCVSMGVQVKEATNLLIEVTPTKNKQHIFVKFSKVVRNVHKY